MNPSPYRLDLVDVIVHVTDVNDNAPTIRFPSSEQDMIDVPNNAPIRHLVGQVTASDPDEDQRFLFRFDEKNGVKEFTIDSESGNVYVNSSLQSLLGMMYRLPLIVSDSGIPEKSASAILNILVSEPSEKSGLAAKPVTVSSKSQANFVTAIIVTAVTLAIVVILLFTIFFCKRKRRDWSPDATSDKSSRKSDVTQDTNTTLPSLNVSPEFTVDLCHYGSEFDDPGYLDVGGRTSLSHPVCS